MSIRKILFVKLKKIQKSEKDWDWPDFKPIIFWKYVNNNKTEQKSQKNTTFPKTITIRVGAWPIHRLPIFSRIFKFFLPWQNPQPVSAQQWPSKPDWLITKYFCKVNFNLEIIEYSDFFSNKNGQSYTILT